MQKNNDRVYRNQKTFTCFTDDNDENKKQKAQ